MITIKSDREISLMKEAGRITAYAHEMVAKAIRPGVSTLELDKIAYDAIISQGATPSFLNYNGFPATICASINEVVVHGIPNKKTILKNGDIISIDIKEAYNAIGEITGNTTSEASFSKASPARRHISSVLCLVSATFTVGTAAAARKKP